MTDWLLGLIALATLTTALLQVIVIVSLLRIGRRTLTRVERIKSLLSSLPTHLAEVSANMSRARALASGHGHRLSALYDTVAPVVRQGVAALALARGASSILRRSRGGEPPKQSNAKKRS